MANVRHEHRVGGFSQKQQPSKAPRLQTENKDRLAPIANRVKWILAGIMLGAAAGWTIFQAFLTLVTLD